MINIVEAVWMIKPHENRRHMTLFNLSKKPAALCKDGLIFVKDGDHVLHDENTNEIFFHQSKLSLLAEDEMGAIFICEINERKIFAIEKGGLRVEKASYIMARSILDDLHADTRKALYRSCQLLNWHRQSNFCGCCGSRMQIDMNEFAKVCDANPSHRYYPQYSPSIIVLVTYETQLLLGRSAHFPAGMYSTLAGFIEAGETAEEAVKREVMEEVGVDVINIRPISTAPWPFPNSLMLAFEATAVTRNLVVNRDELEDAQWFDYNKLPPLPPKTTISYELIARGVQECERREQRRVNPLV